MYPQVCQQVNVCSPVADVGTPSPVELSRRLNSLPCALSFHRDELPSSLLHLVLESRHVGLCLRNVLQLWAAASVSLSTLQLGAALLFLPPVLTTGQVLWMSCLTVPILSTSMMGAPTDSRVMNIATGKNIRSVDREVIFTLQIHPQSGISLQNVHRRSALWPGATDSSSCHPSLCCCSSTAPR